MWKIKLLIRQFKCNHEYYRVRKAYGDERVHTLYRSTWRCSDCGKLKHSTWMDRP